MLFIPIYITILAITIAIDYWAGIKIEESSYKKKKRYLIYSIISTCMVLFIFKYFNFFNNNFAAVANFLNLNYPIRIMNIILPIGLSFHTFQSLSYVIEVYRGNQKAERHFGIYSLYVMFYPQLVAGPIERPQNLLHQFREKHQFDYLRVSEGLKLMIWGFFKKVVVADRLSVYVNAVYNNPAHHSGATFILATVFFAFQIYCDFSGYSDIALGTAKVMGFDLMQNFRRPYLSQSVAEMWTRWHISLSTWFKDYLYISLGGNRVSKWRHRFNLMITFLISGFWHGANWTYVAWGGINGIALIAESTLKKRFHSFSFKDGNMRKFVCIILTFTFTCLAWVFFRANNISEAIYILSKMTNWKTKLFIDSPAFMLYAMLGVAMVLSNDLVHEFRIHKLMFSQSQHTLIRRGYYISLLMLILLIGVFDGSQFIYFQF